LGNPTSGTAPGCAGLSLVDGASLGAISTAPLSSALDLSTVNATLTQFGANYTVTVTSAASNLIWNDVAFSFANATGGFVGGPGLDTVAINGSSGCGIATGFTLVPLYSSPLVGKCPAGPTGGGARVVVGDTVTVANPSAFHDNEALFSAAGTISYGGWINRSIPAPSGSPNSIGASLAVSAPAVSSGGTGSTYSVTVTYAAVGLVWAEVAAEILNSTGSPAAGAYEVDVYGPSGCGIATGTPNSSYYYAPILGACSSVLGRAAPIVSGDKIVVSCSSPLSAPLAAPRTPVGP
jgi:hypothetical protein